MKKSTFPDENYQLLVEAVIVYVTTGNGDISAIATAVDDQKDYERSPLIRRACCDPQVVALFDDINDMDSDFLFMEIMESMNVSFALQDRPWELLDMDEEDYRDNVADHDGLFTVYLFVNSRLCREFSFGKKIRISLISLMFDYEILCMSCVTLKIFCLEKKRDGGYSISNIIQ